ncbi:MAG: type VI secretion system tube protein Hcp [Planctomycetales bacterium]|nr:type VI secretion system tube protein Hcp [Planctomycetales bacterium]
MNHRFATWLVGALFAFHVGIDPAVGALEAYLKVADIEGDFTDAIHSGWSELLTYDISVQNAGWTSGTHQTTPSLSDMYVTKFTDKASPLLFRAVLTGEHFSEARIEVRDPAAPTSYIEWWFQDVVISAYNTVFDEQSVELIAIDFGWLSYDYFAPGSGSIHFEYDRGTNTIATTATATSDAVMLTNFASTSTPEPTGPLLTCLAAGIIARKRPRRKV